MSRDGLTRNWCWSSYGKTQQLKKHCRLDPVMIFFCLIYWLIVVLASLVEHTTASLCPWLRADGSWSILPFHISFSYFLRSGAGPPADRTVVIEEYRFLSQKLFAAVSVFAGLGILLGIVCLTFNIYNGNVRWVRSGWMRINACSII